MVFFYLLLLLSPYCILATTSEVQIDISKPIAFTSSKLASYNFDWHKNSEEPPLWINCSVQVLNLSNVALHTAVQGLQTRLRIGGSEEDKIIYNVTGTECTKANIDPAFCLSMDRWKQIVSFATKNNIDLVFGLNAMVRKNNKSPENFTNIISFLNYTYINKLKVFGFEFGNELESSSVDPTTDGHDFVTLYNIIQSIWKDSSQTPKLIGNDLNPNGGYLQTFLPIVKDVLDVMTYHNYDGYGLDTNLTNEIVTPKFLDKTYNNIKGVYEQYQKQLNTSKTEIWLGEAAAAWHSGQENCTNSFVSSFWYSDAFGRLSLLNHTGFCRQTLIGGAYGLLSREEYKPNPDYYTAKLWHDLVNDNILNVSNISDSLDGYFRAYSYCSRKSQGHIGVLLINISPNINVSAVINVTDNGNNNNNNVVSMNVYQLTADSLHSRFMKMNGKILNMAQDTKLPCLADCPVKIQGNNIQVAPYSIVFIDAILKNKVTICN
eukprot:469371_1